MADSLLGLSIIGVVFIMYLNHNEAAKSRILYKLPDTSREIDLSRWRHDGSQPTMWYKGNGSSFVDETTQKLELMVS
jgi:hypothetical protein